jgi:hypothetical protein
MILLTVHCGHCKDAAATRPEVLGKVEKADGAKLWHQLAPRPDRVSRRLFGRKAARWLRPIDLGRHEMVGAACSRHGKFGVPSAQLTTRSGTLDVRRAKADS